MYRLIERPTRSFRPKSRGRSAEVPLFEPFEENLPLQSGFYSFVIDGAGRLRVRAGNTRSHAGMAGGSKAAAAGSLRISREGKLAEVFCRSTDYRIRYRTPADAAARYVLRYFKQHPAFPLSDHAIFEFSQELARSFHVDVDGREIPAHEIAERRRWIDEEGITRLAGVGFTRAQLQAWASYRPTAPPVLYAPHLDQLIAALEGDPEVRYEEGEPAPIYTPEAEPFTGGKYNFVIDASGRLIVGPIGHHLLSGCRRVGGAGHIRFDERGIVTEVHLNFSGHYRPPLSADYARYAFRAIEGHPLIRLAADCLVQGRLFDEESYATSLLRFRPEELRADDDRLEFGIEAASL